MTTVALDPTVAEFQKLVEQLRAAWDPAKARQLEELARRLLPRIAALGSASLAALEGAMVTLFGLLTSPLVVLPAAYLAWWYLMYLALSAAMSGDRNARTVNGILIAIGGALVDMGIPPERLRRECFDEFERALRELLAQQPADEIGDLSDSVVTRLAELLGELLECLGLDLSAGDQDKLLGRLLKRYLAAGLGISLGVLLGAGEAEAFDEEDDRLAREAGLKGLPRADGLGWSELPPPDDRDWGEDGAIGWEDVIVDPSLPLGGFTDEELERRKALLEKWLRDLEKEIDKGQRELDRLRKRSGKDADDGRADALQRFLQGLRREAERVRRALENARRECRLRGHRAALGEERHAAGFLLGPPVPWKRPWAGGCGTAHVRFG